jgi:lysyl endopeptidase
VSFTRGVIEGGSSGSGIFSLSPTQGLLLRGILSGTTIRQAGGLSCTNLNELALYGRFEAFYPTIRPIIMNVAQSQVDVDASMPSPSAREIPLGGSVTARIDYPGDLDVFRITVTQPGHLTVYSTGGNDLAGALLNSAGSGLVSEDDVESRNNEFGFTYRITTPGTYYVSVGHWDPASTTGNYQVFATFSTATNNYSDIWWNANESGWGLALNHQDNILAGALYTFDTDGQPLYLILSGATRQTDGSYLGPLVRSTGPVFNTVPWPAAQVQRTTVGSMQLNFLSNTSLDISYTVNGTPVNKSLTRLTYATAPTCNFNGFDRSYARNYQDIWWNPNEDGWGLNIIHQSDIISIGLYTYDASGRNAWYLMAPGTRLSGSTVTYSGPLKRVTGPVFNAAPWTATNETTVGTMSMTITNGNQATLQYTINGVAVTKQIQRFTFSNPATECETAQ